MNSLTFIIAPLIALQGVGQAPAAVENDAPETWTLEYPRIIQPFVEDYRRCLTGQMRFFSGEANFEMQHRSDVPECADELEEAQGAANLVLSRRGDYSDYTPDDIREVFEHLHRIHIARGADLDGQFTYWLRRSEIAYNTYQAERPKGLVLELHDASVVKARTDATAAAAEAARAEYEAEMAAAAAAAEQEEGAISATD